MAGDDGSRRGRARVRFPARLGPRGSAALGSATRRGARGLRSAASRGTRRGPQLWSAARRGARGVGRLWSAAWRGARGIPDPWPLLSWSLALLFFWTGIFYLRDHAELGPLTLPVAALVALPLVLVPRSPLAAWWLVLGAGFAGPVAFPTDESLPWSPQLIITAVLVLFVVALRYRARIVLGVGALSIAAVVWGLVAVDSPAYRDDLPGPVVPVTLVLAGGYLVGGRRRAQRRLVEGERRLEEVQTGRALLEERTRIARELHDVVAHHMSLVAVQAETAPYRIPDLPVAGRETLDEIASTAREALTEMRRLLGVLRSEDSGADRLPQPGLAQLDALVANATRTGVPVASTVTGTPRPLPPGVDLSAYRIVQEALSNAVRHAPGAGVRVEVGYEPALLRIRVANGAAPGGATPPAAWGHGLLGMRERVAMLGGRLSAGPAPDGGYVVEADLPLPVDLPR